METTNKLEKVLIEKEREFASDPEFVRLREFYEEMKRQGLAKKQEYSLPPLDTVGLRQLAFEQLDETECRVRVGHRRI